jgi:hypothetical protein
MDAVVDDVVVGPAVFDGVVPGGRLLVALLVGTAETDAVCEALG